MKRLAKLTVGLLSVLSMSSCTTIDSGSIGIKFYKWAASEDRQGGVDGTCRGFVWYNPFTSSIFEYPTYVQRKDFAPFTVNAKDASTFTMDPTLAYRLDEAKACQVFVKYRKSLEELENGYIRTCIYDAYRICANEYTSDALMSSRAEFEAKVKQRLEQTLSNEGFIVEEFTSQITPPQSLADMIDSKNRAVQSSLRAENLVKEAEANAKIEIAKAEGAAKAMKIKADAEAYYNKTISASLTDKIVAEDWIEKWDGKLPTMSGNGNCMIDISKMIR